MHVFNKGDRVRVLQGPYSFSEALLGEPATVVAANSNGSFQIEFDHPTPSAEGSWCHLPSWLAPITAPTKPPPASRSERNKPFNIAQNAAKRAVSEVLGIKQKHVHSGMEAYRVAYAAVRHAQEAGL